MIKDIKAFLLMQGGFCSSNALDLSQKVLPAAHATEGNYLFYRLFY